MKKKILLVCLILVSILFINIEKVYAEEYQVGDVVELLNPSGNSGEKFYIVKKQEPGDLSSSQVNYTYYVLMSILPVQDCKKALEFFINPYYSIVTQKKAKDDFSYIFDIEDSITPHYSFIQGLSLSLNSCEEKKINNNLYYKCPEFLSDYKNSLVNDSYIGSNYVFSYIEKSDIEDYTYVLREFVSDNKQNPIIQEARDSKILNYYIRLIVEEPNLQYLKKSSYISGNKNSCELNNNLNSVDNNIPKETNGIENPKTADVKIALVIFGILVAGVFITIGYKEVKKKG